VEASEEKKGEVDRQGKSLVDMIGQRREKKEKDPCRREGKRGPGRKNKSVAELQHVNAREKRIDMMREKQDVPRNFGGEKRGRWSLREKEKRCWGEKSHSRGEKGEDQRTIGHGLNRWNKRGGEIFWEKREGEKGKRSIGRKSLKLQKPYRSVRDVLRKTSIPRSRNSHLFVKGSWREGGKGLEPAERKPQDSVTCPRRRGKAFDRRKSVPVVDRKGRWREKSKGGDDHATAREGLGYGPSRLRKGKKESGLPHMFSTERSDILTSLQGKRGVISKKVSQAQRNSTRNP